MADLLTMYPAQAGSPETSIAGALTAAGTTVNVVDGAILPNAPNLLTLGAEGGVAETVLMTAKSGNTLTITRAQDGTASRAWAAGTTIGRYFMAADQTAIQTNITLLNEGKLEKPTSPTSGNLATFDASGEVADSGKKASDFATATQGGKADTALQPVASPTSGNFAGLDANGKVTDSGKKASDFATASHIHSGYAQIKVFSSVAVASAAWSSDATYAAFPFSATITASGVTSDMVPEVNFGLTEAASGNFGD